MYIIYIHIHKDIVIFRYVLREKHAVFLRNKPRNARFEFAHNLHVDGHIEWNRSIADNLHKIAMKNRSKNR